MSSGSQFTSVQVAGNLLPSDLLSKVIDASELDGLRPADYHLAPGEGLRQAASRAWDYLTGVWQAYRREIDNLGESAPTTGITRERWLLILLRELGFGRVPTTPSGGLAVGDSDEEQFPVSHRWGPVPIHLLGWGIALDRRTKGVAGAAGAAPQSMLQELLNRSDEYLWGIVANGQRLRLLRDSTSLTGSAYVEFDLEAIFDGELFSDFVLLYLLVHQSRFDVAEGAGPESCWLETWRNAAAEQGTRALERLREGVEEALTTLGTGFLQHPDNAGLREALASGRLSKEDYQRALLRVAYRLLFWLITEARGALLDPYADGKARDRYERYFSANRLRELARRRRRGDRHGDLWQSVRLVFDGLAAEDGLPKLGLPGLGGLFDLMTVDEPLENAGDPSSSKRRAELPNEALLGAMRALTIVREKGGGQRRLVDFRNLGADELGSVYESLLELHPQIDTQRLTFTLHGAAGNERKLTGSYYTPGSLIQSLLDSALDPLLDEAQRANDPVESLLSVTVCDPACGSGHFLVAAARRIAKRVAALETEEAEPSPSAVQAALRRVVGRCIHGVDMNPMAAELAKVALWLEAMEPGKPLSFLDANIRVGNSLLGVAPKLLADGIPNEAFKALEGDSKDVVKRLTKANKEQRAGVFDLFSQGVGTTNAALARATASVLATPETLAEVRRQQNRFDDVERQRSSAQLAADTWCAAFVQPKTADTESVAITQGALLRAGGQDGIPDSIATRVRELAQDYGFFHWHLEFPHIFQVPDDGDVDPDTGWSGGFTCVLGNPPWDKIEFKEQEFFDTREPSIANASGAKRKKLIQALARSDEPADRALYDSFVATYRRVESTAHLIRNSGRYPLTGRGRLNTYAAFAENDRTIIGQRGRAGVVLPTGIATDATTQHFFRDLVETESIASLYDFENRKGIFPDVDSRTKFCLFTMSGRAVRETNARFAFFALDVADLAKPDVVFSLSPEEIKLLNPNTGTLPVFRSRRDAEITLGIYRRVPVLVNENDPENGNPWGVSFMQGLFNMTSDSHLFHTREDLEHAGWTLEGNIFTRGEDRMVPLYEGRMGHQYNHRFSSSDGDESSLEDLDHSDFLVRPAYWVSEIETEKRLGRRKFACNTGLLGFRRVARNTDERTCVATILPWGAASYGWIISAGPKPVGMLVLASIYNSFIFDYLIRNSLIQPSIPQSTVEQLPALHPDGFPEKAPWSLDESLEDWVTRRVLELIYTSIDLAAFANDVGDTGAPFRWCPARREILHAELDAAYFHLYRVQRNDAQYIMETFPIVKQKEQYSYGEYRSKHLILAIYDSMSEAIAAGEPYKSRLDPAPGKGPRHLDLSDR